MTTKSRGFRVSPNTAQKPMVIRVGATRTTSPSAKGVHHGGASDYSVRNVLVVGFRGFRAFLLYYCVLNELRTKLKITED